jgi:hypothetical protein
MSGISKIREAPASPLPSAGRGVVTKGNMTMLDSMTIFDAVDVNWIGYRVFKAVRAGLTRAIREYEDEHLPLEEQARAAFDEAYAGRPAPVPEPDVGDDVVPLHAAVVKQTLDEARAEIESGALRGLILFKVYADGAHSHMSVSRGGSAIGPADFALAGAALTQVGLQRAGWAAPAGDLDDEEDGEA